MSDTDNSEGIQFLRINQVLEKIPVSRSSWWAGCKSGRYPNEVPPKFWTKFITFIDIWGYYLYC